MAVAPIHFALLPDAFYSGDRRGSIRRQDAIGDSFAGQFAEDGQVEIHRGGLPCPGSEMGAVLLDGFPREASGTGVVGPGPEVVEGSRVRSPGMARGHAVDDQRAATHPSPDGRLLRRRHNLQE